MLKYTLPVIATQGKCEGFFRESSATTFDTDNAAYKARKALAQQDSFELYFKISSPIFDQIKFLPYNCSMRIRLRRSPNTFYLIGETAANETFGDHIIFTDSYMDVRRVQVHSRITQMHDQTLDKGGKLYWNIWNDDVISYALLVGTLSHTSDNLLSALPSFACIALVDSKSFNAEAKSSPFTFLHKTLNGVMLTLNGEPVNYSNLKFDTGSHEYTRIYRQLINLKGSYGNVDLSPDDWLKHGYFIIPLIWSNNNRKDRYQMERPGAVKIHLSFKDATTKSLNVLFYYVTPKQISIDKSHVYVT